MNSQSFNKLRLSVGTGVVGSALLLAGGAVSRVQAADSKPRGGAAVTVTRTGYFWYVSNDTNTNSVTGFGLTEASSTTSRPTTGGSSGTLSDAFDGCEIMAINGIGYEDPDGTIDVVGNAAIGDPDTIAGLTVSREFRWMGARPNGTATMRSLNNFTNSGSSPVSVTVEFGCNLGSDGSTFIEGFSTGGMLRGGPVVPDDALWFVSSDEQPYSDPPVTHIRFGEGTSVVPYFTDSAGGGKRGAVSPGAGNDDWVDNYDITVPPGQTVHILRFIGLNNGAQLSLADAPIFESLTSIAAAGLVSDIPLSAQANILNFGPAGPVAPTFAVPTMGKLGMGLMAGFLALLGMLGIRRMS